MQSAAKQLSKAQILDFTDESRRSGDTRRRLFIPQEQLAPEETIAVGI